ncbi:hypothetical protein [Singulisphaera acidiphila]|uniref:Uncharacterized protein n=1 Tax=Singulisphaera acidiphila (strain ATCC BAA-1392 / DSM 18658 / VKM B-2454 / MOB10) TaxID=886293 RepID=L0DMI9_SINAD|nr:hypothetical protein [Singulisphaera acidiphila]AGA30467.1 hypothetical protein Sinac_6387 [Singulisphaera acidiphila DSM 18658]
MARLATAKKSAATTLNSGGIEQGSQPRTKPAQTTRTAKSALPVVWQQPVVPVLNDCEVPSLESEFIQAMQEYKKASGRMFPTWSEVLEVLQSLGYRKTDPNASGTESA